MGKRKYITENFKKQIIKRLIEKYGMSEIRATKETKYLSTRIDFSSRYAQHQGPEDFADLIAEDSERYNGY